nr:DUF6542 domain-containing protein [Streptomyces sp. SAT1]
MEQPRTRPQQHGPRRGRPPLPGQGARGRPHAPRPERTGGRGPGPAARAPRPTAGPGLRGPAALVRRLRQSPNPRLTGLGGGLFCGAAMLVLGCLDALLLGGSPAVYGVLFLPVCVLTALWMRPGDVLTAPVVAPLGFTVGLLPVADGDSGVLGTLVGLVTGLATQALWLYGGTLLAGVVALVRRGAARGAAHGAERAASAAPARSRQRPRPVSSASTAAPSGSARMRGRTRR